MSKKENQMGSRNEEGLKSRWTRGGKGRNLSLHMLLSKESPAYVYQNLSPVSTFYIPLLPGSQGILATFSPPWRSACVQLLVTSSACNTALLLWTHTSSYLTHHEVTSSTVLLQYPHLYMMTSETDMCIKGRCDSLGKAEGKHGRLHLGYLMVTQFIEDSVIPWDPLVLSYVRMHTHSDH